LQAPDTAVHAARIIADHTPLELLDRLAALVPRPRIHCHSDCGMLAPHSPLRGE